VTIQEKCSDAGNRSERKNPKTEEIPNTEKMVPRRRWWKTRCIPSMFASLLEEILEDGLERLWVLRLCDVAVLVQTVLGKTTSAKLNAELQKFHHDLFCNFGPCFMSTRGNNAVEGFESLGFVTEPDVLCRRRKEKALRSDF
jgi:hypothetical protein